MKLMKLTLGILLVAQQTPQTVTGRIEGTVLLEGTTEPVIGAEVVVTRVNPAMGVAIPTAGAVTSYLVNPSPNVPLPGAPARPGPGGPPAPEPLPIPPVINDRGSNQIQPHFR